MSSDKAINKVFGAIALSDSEGSLTSLSSEILSVGDVGLVVTGSAFYVYKVFESGSAPSKQPYALDNPPYILKPEDNKNTNLRWHLVSPIFFNENIKIDKNNFIKTAKIVRR